MNFPYNRHISLESCRKQGVCYAVHEGESSDRREGTDIRFTLQFSRKHRPQVNRERRIWFTCGKSERYGKGERDSRDWRHGIVLQSWWRCRAFFG